MATASTTGPDLTRTPGRVLRVLALPAGIALLALLVGAAIGHVAIGLFIALGVGLGVANGLLMESAAARMDPAHAPERSDIVKGSLGRLGLISMVALAIAFFAQPNGWLVLIGLAGYQLLSLAARLGAAAKEARLG